jgi:ABC-type branched-subunit amino acid transport system substrate-binding protein
MWELGLSAPVIGSVLPPEIMVARAGDAVYGRFQDYSCVDFQSPTWSRLAAKYQADYRRYFDNSALSGYVTVKMVADAAKRANTTSPQALAEAIRKGRFVQPGHGWPLSYTEWGEMKEARPIIFVIERGQAGGANWAQKWLFRPAAVEPYVPSE